MEEGGGDAPAPHSHATLCFGALQLGAALGFHLSPSGAAIKLGSWRGSNPERKRCEMDEKLEGGARAEV